MNDERRAELIADAEYLIGKLNIAWLKGRDLTGLTTDTLEHLTNEMWRTARNRAADQRENEQ